MQPSDNIVTSPVPKRTRVNGRKKQVLAVADALNTVSAQDLVEELEITEGNAFQLLSALVKSGDLIRTGPNRYERAAKAEASE